MRIERTRIDGEPVRRFHLLAEVTFRDREAEPRDEHDRNYYRDHELSGVVTGWMRNALEDRDDSPAVRFTEMNHPNILNELRHGYDEIIKLKEMISKLTSLEQTPGSLNGNDARALLRIVWQWIIDANNGNGADSDDLIHELERAGYQCPAELENVMTPRLRALSPAVMERAVVVWGRELAKGLTPGGALVTVLSEVLPLHAGATAIDSDFMAAASLIDSEKEACWSESLTNAYWSAVNAPTNPEAADKTLALLNAYAPESGTGGRRSKRPGSTPQGSSAPGEEA